MADTPEKLAEEAKILAAELEKLKAMGDELTTAQQRQFALYASHLAKLKQASMQQQQIANNAKLRLEQMKEESVYDQQKEESIRKQIETNNSRAAAYEVNQAQIDSALQNTREITKKVFEERAAMAQESDATRLQLSQQQEQDSEHLLDLYGKTALGVTTAMKGTISEMDAPMAMMAASFPRAMESMIAEQKAQFTKGEKGLKSIGKELGFVSKEIENVAVGAADMQWLERTFGPEASKRIADWGGGFKGVGSNIEDTSKTLKTLLDTSMAIRPSFVEDDPAAAAFIANQVTGYEKLGATREKQAEFIDKNAKALGMSQVEAVKQMAVLQASADSTDMSLKGALQGYNDNFGTFVQYGEQSIEVYSRMQAQAVATGAGMKGLTEWANQMDDFKGATEVAQGFNAVLGDNLLDMEKLKYADHPEKIRLIQEAWQKKGVAFDAYDREMQKVIAGTLKLNSIEEAAKILSEENSHGYEVRASKMDLSAKSTQEMTERIRGTMTTTELLTRNQDVAQGGMFKFMNRTQEFGEKGAQAILSVFNQVLGVVQDTEAAAIATVTAFEMLVKGTGNIAEALGKGNIKEAVESAIPLGLTAGVGIFAPQLAEAVGATPKAKTAEAFPASERRGLLDLATERTRAGTGDTEQNRQIMELVSAIKDGTLLQADITTNLNLDGKTIDTITQKTSSKAATRVKEEMNRKARNLPTAGL